ncbi:Protein STABILIZED1 [Bienertia sinuspersici]
MIQAARQFIKKGCEECPKNQDAWLQACRLASLDDAKAMIARGVKAIPSSVKLWLQASKLEQDDMNKSRVLKKGLENIPDSMRLWKSAVEIANEEDVRLLLMRAVECFPLHKIIGSGIRALQREGVAIDREAWMREAEATDVLVLLSLVNLHLSTLWKRTWVADVEECKKRGSIETVRAIYAHALSVFLTKKSILLKGAQLEKSHGIRESLDALLRRAFTYVPQAEVLWLMGTKKIGLQVMCLLLEPFFRKHMLLFHIPRRFGLLLSSWNLKS